MIIKLYQQRYNFQFYNSKSKLIFKVAISQGDIIAVINNGAIPYGEPTFDYTKTGDNKAECWVSIRYQFPLGDYISYGGYIGRVEVETQIIELSSSFLTIEESNEEGSEKILVKETSTYQKI